MQEGMDLLWIMNTHTDTHRHRHTHTHTHTHTLTTCSFEDLTQKLIISQRLCEGQRTETNLFT